MEEYAALIAMDWADRQHAISLYDSTTGKRERAMVQHTPSALQEWALGLKKRFAGQRLAVCLEQARGPLVYALLKYDFLVLYPINPTTLAKYRAAFSPALGKDDPSDADYLLDLLQHHRERLRPWYPEDPQVRRLRLLVEQRRRLVNDQTRLNNRLREVLKSYFPQVLDWFGDLATVLVCDFLERWPTLEKLQRARSTTLLKFFRAHHSINQSTNDRRLAELKSAVALTNDPAIITTAPLHVKILISQLRPTMAAIAAYEREIELVCQQLQDYELFAALPGAGLLHAARLTAAFGSDRTRWPTVEELLCYSGVAPVIERSGKQQWIRWRYFCPKFLRQTFVEYAGESIKVSSWARVYYNMQRAKGKEHHAAVRALAFKWIRILWKCWLTRTPYNEDIYLASLELKRSPLLSFATHHSGHKTP
jgi:transposase